jgi:hypothetical protein
MQGYIAALVADKGPGRSIAVEERDLNFLRQVLPQQYLDPTALRQVHEQAQRNIPRLLDQGLEAGQLGRLEQLKVAGHLLPDRAADLAQTFEFMLTLRIRRQWKQFQTGQPVSNYLNPAHLSALDRRRLRRGFKVIAYAQADLKEAYHVKVGRLFFGRLF